MKLSEMKSGRKASVKAIALSKQYQQRLLPIGIYPGATIQMHRQGNSHYPALLLVRGNFMMMRIKDIVHIEMEE